MFTTMTKAQMRTLIRGLGRDIADIKIGDAALDLLTQVTQDRLWSQIIARAPWYVTINDSIASLNAPGYVTLDPASADTAKVTKRFFRMQSLVRDSQVYGPLDPREIALDPSATDNTALFGGNVRTLYRYTVRGTKCYLFPLNLTPAVQVSYIYLPTRYTTLAETDVVDWPDGHEAALAYTVAARVNPADQTLDPLATQAISDMLASIERQYSGPLMPYHGDTPQSWGSE